MSIFLDTSGLLAIINADDKYHVHAKKSWIEIISNNEYLLTTNYIIIETISLLQSRIGFDAVHTLHEDIIPVLHLQFINEAIHNAAMSALVTASRRNLSFVDCASFECMRRLGIKKAFTFDSHFSEQGFECIP